ncbi:MAG: hypothetical protein NW203_01910 [Hyphomonadaceae bacterium]|nr:hypothetical protein [Hyphomonadaceae bacterium]
MASPEDQIAASLSGAQRALDAFARGPARQAADAVAEAFEASGDRIARAMVGASFDGETAVRRLAKTILEELARTALAAAAARSDPVSSKGAAARSAVNVVFNLAAGADAPSIARSQGQIAAQIARAVGYGSRNL